MPPAPPLWSKGDKYPPSSGRHEEVKEFSSTEVSPSQPQCQSGLTLLGGGGGDDCPVHHRRLSSISGLYPLDVSRTLVFDEKWLQTLPNVPWARAARFSTRHFTSVYLEFEFNSMTYTCPATSPGGQNCCPSFIEKKEVDPTGSTTGVSVETSVDSLTSSNLLRM